jgi:ankyrin repeat protein
VYGWTPLIIASHSGNAEVVSPLLEYGVDKDKSDNDGKTAYFFACQFGHVETATALSEAGATLGDISGLKDYIARFPDFWPTFEAASKAAGAPSNIDFAKNYSDMAKYDGTN